VIADDIDQEDLQPYLDYVRAPDSGYENVTFPDGDEGMEISCRTSFGAQSPQLASRYRAS
jgi:hypothetical protein